MKKTAVLLLAALLALSLLSGCSSESSSGSPSPSSEQGGGGSDHSHSSASSSSSSPDNQDDGEDMTAGNITASGSTALQPLLIQAVDSFKSKEKFVGAVTVNGGGSVQGLLDIASGAVDIGCSDISPTQAGLDETGLVDHQVGVVLIAVAVSSDVAANLSEITTVDLRDIYTGAITDWKDVAGWKGTSLPIAAYSYHPGSGTRIIFETYGILAPPGSDTAAHLSGFNELHSPANLSDVLKAKTGGIGYAAYPYCSNASLLNLDGVEPTYENVYSGQYRLWACQHLYTKGEPAGAAGAFIEYLTSEDFEEIVTEGGYGLISEMKVSR